MKRFQILDEQGQVVNTILADQAFMEATYQGRYRAVADTPSQQPDTAPQRVTRYQAYTALSEAGLYSQIEAWIGQPDTDEKYRIAWLASDFRRDSELIAAAASLFNLSDEQVDALFLAASQVS